MDKEFIKEYIAEHKKAIIAIASGVVVLIAAAAIILPAMNQQWVKPEVPFDEVPVYDRLQTYSSSDAINSKGVGSMYTRCDESVDALHSYSVWPGALISHEVTEEGVEDTWSYEYWDAKDYYGVDDTEGDDTDVENDSVIPTEDGTNPEPAPNTDETPQVEDAAPALPDIGSLGPVDLGGLAAPMDEEANADEDDDGYREYVLVDNEYCTMTVTEVVDIPGVGFELYSLLETKDVPEGMSFESTIHLSQYWEKEHEIVYLEELESNCVYEIYTLVVTDDWDEDVYIVYLATTSALYLYDKADDMTYLERCEMTEIYDASYGSDEPQEAPSTNPVDEPLI